MRFIIANTTAAAINNQVADILVEGGLSAEDAATATTIKEDMDDIQAFIAQRKE